MMTTKRSMMIWKTSLMKIKRSMTIFKSSIRVLCYQKMSLNCMNVKKQLIFVIVVAWIIIGIKSNNNNRITKIIKYVSILVMIMVLVFNGRWKHYNW